MPEAAALLASSATDRLNPSNISNVSMTGSIETSAAAWTLV